MFALRSSPSLTVTRPNARVGGLARVAAPRVTARAPRVVAALATDDTPAVVQVSLFVRVVVYWRPTGVNGERAGAQGRRGGESRRMLLERRACRDETPALRSSVCGCEEVSRNLSQPSLTHPPPLPTLPLHSLPKRSASPSPSPATACSASTLSPNSGPAASP